MYSRNAADAGAYCHRVVLSWALFPAMVATGTDRIFANLFWMGGDDLEGMKSGLSSQKRNHNVEATPHNSRLAA